MYTLIIVNVCKFTLALFADGECSMQNVTTTVHPVPLRSDVFNLRFACIRSYFVQLFSPSIMMKT